MLISRLLSAGLGLALMAQAAADAAPMQVAGFSHVKSLGGIDEYRLDANGLTVLVKPDHSAPVVTFQVTYRVGSRNEVTGTTGATHLLEHLMFKGSESFNDRRGNSIDRYLGQVGASFNATTWLDRTNYYATLGRDSLEGYIAIEADRMRNLWLHEADRRAEMTVVRNEYECGENNPRMALVKEVYAAAYVAQPYGHNTIGWRSDIEQVPIEKLRAFYDAFYWPNNATVSIIGDLDPARALSLIQKHYGEIPRSPEPIPEVYTKEPPQSGARRVTVKRAGQLGTVNIAYKVPNARDADLPALSVLASILIDGKNSRFSRALVDTSLATYVYGDVRPLHDPGLFMVGASVAPGVAHEQAEKALAAEIDRVTREGVSAAEVAQVFSRYRASEAYGRDGTSAVAAALNEWIAAGDWTLYVTYVDQVANVTPADVQRVARKYLQEDQSTTGWFVPVVSK